MSRNDEQKMQVTVARSRRRSAVLVLGMHRSGTSATTRVLNLLGADLSENLMGPGYSNDHGFWEHMEAFQINDRLLRALGMSWNDPRRMPSDWQNTPESIRALREIVVLLEKDFAEAPLWAVKDPRICRLVPLWKKALDNQKVSGYAVIVLRHPDEIADSLAVRDGLSRGQVHLLWARHLCEAERATRGMPRCVIRYDAMLRDWRMEFSQAGQALGLEWPVEFNEVSEQIDSFLHRDSRHHVMGRELPSSVDARTHWVDLAYQVFAAVPDTQDWTQACALVDDFERATRVSDVYLEEKLAELDVLVDNRARFENTAALVHSIQEKVIASLTESEMRVEASAAEKFAGLDERVLSMFAKLLSESESRMLSGLSAGLEVTNDAIDQHACQILAVLQENVRWCQEQKVDVLARVAEEITNQAARSNELSERMDGLIGLVSEHGQEVDALLAEIARLRVQLNGSRLELQRQQHNYAATYGALHEYMEAVFACALLQTSMLWGREKDMAELSEELESTKQSLDAAIRLADSLEDKLKYATRPWYEKMGLGKGMNEGG